MISRIRKRLTYTNVLMTLALIFAMSGSAYAASKYVITSTKQISPKVLKTLKGANGAAGPTGPQGSAGTAAVKGEAGANGTNGTNGESVTMAELKPGATCEDGGAEFKVATSKTHACNGTTGYTKNLPSGKTETGAWTVTASNESHSISAISFAIPLAKTLGATEVHYVNENGTEEVAFTEKPLEFKLQPTASCPGTVAEPAATPGNLCIYQRHAEGARDISGFTEAIIRPANAAPEGPGALTPGAATTGALISLIKEEEKPVFAYGTWAVAAP